MLRISPKEWEALAELEAKFPGCVRIQSVGRNHARLWVSNGACADIWTFKLEPSLKIYRVTAFSRELSRYARLRAREAMLAVRLAHQEYVERMRAKKNGRPTFSKKVERLKAKAAQYPLPLLELNSSSKWGKR